MRLRLSSRLLTVVLVASSLVAIWGFAVILAAPRISDIYPVPGSSAVPPGVPFRLVFSTSMQPDTVLARLSIDPPVRGSFNWQGNSLFFLPDQPWPSKETITIRLAAGASSAGFPSFSIRQGQSWTFSVGMHLLAYLWPADGPSDLYSLNPISGQIERLSNHPQGVLDFSVDSSGSRIYYSASNPHGGSDLYHLEWSKLPPPGSDAGISEPAGPQLLLDCHEVVCRSPRLSPDGSLLAFERAAVENQGRSVQQVWLLPLEVGEPVLAGEPGHPTQLPAWSSNGILAFYDAVLKGFVFRDPSTGLPGVDQAFLPNLTGVAGDWSPDGQSFVVPEIVLPSPSPLTDPSTNLPSSSHLIRFQPANGQSEDMTLADNLEDAAPAFSPDGTWMAFARKSLDLGHWSRGRQLWVMHPDGSQASQLTADSFYTHYGFSWSPDSLLLAFLRFNQDILTSPPELWLVDADGKNPLQLVIGGYAPQWIP